MSILILVTIMAICAAPAAAYRSVTVDPDFAYYKDRSPESIVDEIRANGFQDVRQVCVDESGINADLVKAFAREGIEVWMLTFANGSYSTSDLPKGWEAWKMKLRNSDGVCGFTYLCPNNTAYREWKKKRLTSALNAHPFYGVDLAEAFLPAYLGPESAVYGCLCDSCRTAFSKAYGSEPPDFEDAGSPRYWKTDRVLYEKWVGFRVSTVVNFLDDLVNGRGGIREKCPRAKVATWSLGLDVSDQLAKLREWEALDAAAIVKRVKPDMHVIQTDWPDWIKTNLPGDYPLKYRPVADAVRDVSPQTPLMLQADIGSKENMRRGREWMRQVEKAARQIHCESVTYYEYHLGDYIYTEAPAVVQAELEPGAIKLIFNKRLDTVSASNIANYTLTSGHVDYARVDGNVVRLSVSGVEEGVGVTVSGLSDDEPRRFFHDKPPCAMEGSVQVTTR